MYVLTASVNSQTLQRTSHAPTHSHPQLYHGLIIIRQARKGGQADIIAVAARALHLAAYLQRAGKLTARAVVGGQALDGQVRVNG